MKVVLNNKHLAGKLIDNTMYVKARDIANTLKLPSYFDNSTKTYYVGSYPLLGKKVLIDPGHDGTKEPGAIGNGLYEAYEVLKVAKELNEKLRALGATTYMTRTTNDGYTSLSERTRMAVNNNVDIFISIHLNSSTNTSATGTETYVYKFNGPKSMKLANAIHLEILKILCTINRGVKEGNFQVIREPFNKDIPGVLLELAFISNSRDAALVKQQDFPLKVANAITTGVMKYFST